MAWATSTTLTPRRSSSTGRGLCLTAASDPGLVPRVLHRSLLRTAQLYGFDLATPFEQYPQKIQNLILFGRGARTRSGKRTFPGIIPLLDRWHEETHSEKYTEWLERYMSAVRCPLCRGQRLRPESLAVKVDGLSIAELTALSINRISEFTRKIRLSGREEIPRGSHRR